jgi:hypothetical protein
MRAMQQRLLWKDTKLAVAKVHFTSGDIKEVNQCTGAVHLGNLPVNNMTCRILLLTVLNVLCSRVSYTSSIDCASITAAPLIVQNK